MMSGRFRIHSLICKWVNGVEILGFKSDLLGMAMQAHLAYYAGVPSNTFSIAFVFHSSHLSKNVAPASCVSHNNFGLYQSSFFK